MKTWPELKGCLLVTFNDVGIKKGHGALCDFVAESPGWL